ncbi:MAG: serine/threonine-protein phosphatase [Nitrospirae bacterium]|nr:serine/threonine-protein phosphatase [Nitrospirota bacterium]
MPVVKACYISATGRVRTQNEDSMLLNDILVSGENMQVVSCMRSAEKKLLYAVADGMGGHARGEVASRRVLEIFMEYYPEAKGVDDIGKIISAAKKGLNKIAETGSGYIGLGSTISGMLVLDSGAIVFNCGDSRSYRMTGGELRRMTRDNSFVQELVDGGIITEDEMRRHPHKNIITSAIIGDLRDEVPEFSASLIEISQKERFLICSDGVWEGMENHEMWECFSTQDLQEAVNCLYLKIMEHGGRDNLSVIGIELLT